jgi:hypothetical protein
MDVHLFLIDQVRFELIRRLGWLISFPCENHTLLEVVHAFETTKAEARQEPAALSESHPEYNAYNKLVDAEKQVFIRRKFLKALEEFHSGVLP